MRAGFGQPTAERDGDAQRRRRARGVSGGELSAFVDDRRVPPLISKT
jgi:hypothetical protein